MKNKIFVIIVMFLLVMNVCFAKEEGQKEWDEEWDEAWYWNSDKSWHTSAPSGDDRRGEYTHVTKEEDETWTEIRYDENGKEESVRKSNVKGNKPPPPKDFSEIGKRLPGVDTNNDEKYDQPGESPPGLYYYANGETKADGWYDKDRYYYNEDRSERLGKGFDPDTNSYIPNENDNVRINVDNNNLYMDTNGDGEIDASGKTDRAVSTDIDNYFHDTGRVFVKAGFVDEDGNLWVEPFKTEEEGGEIIGVETTFYWDKSFSYRDPDAHFWEGSHMILPDGTEVWDPVTGEPTLVTPDGSGGYYISTASYAGEPIGDYTVGAGAETIHMVAQQEGPIPYIAVLDRAADRVIFDPDDPSQSFEIDDDVVVTSEWFDDYDKKTDTYGRHIVVRDPDGNLYVIDGNEFLNNLLDSP
ncbi:hypothetical protein KY342_03275, partial [Candidatus Woesearchaeota archaeon]|nr:hypothetical protein [Candidatus Woesearchaeota archaeon]